MQNKANEWLRFKNVIKALMISVLFIVMAPQKYVNAESGFINSIAPSNGSVDVSPYTTEMTVEFTVDIDPDTLMPGNVLVNGGYVLISDVYMETPRNCIIQFAELAPLMAYTVEFSGLKTLAGADIPEFSSTFYTEDRSYNQIKNGDFEDITAGLSGYKASLQFSNQYVHSREYSLKVTGTEAYGHAGFDVKAEGGKTYNYSFWCRLDPLNQTNTRVTAAIQYRDNYHQVQKVVKISPTMEKTGDFIKVSGSYTIEADGIVSEPYIYFYADTPAGVGTFYLDDVEWREQAVYSLLPSSTPINGSENVPVDTDIILNFNADMNLTTLTAGNISINGQSSLIDRIEISEYNKRQCRVLLTQKLEPDTFYVVTVSNVMAKNGDLFPDVSLNFVTSPAFHVEGLALYRDYGAEQQENLLKSCLRAGELTAYIGEVKNNLDKELQFTLLLVVYKDEALYAIQTESVTVSPGGKTAEPVTTSLYLDNIDDGAYSVRLLAWDGLNSIMPLSPMLGKMDEYGRFKTGYLLDENFSYLATSHDFTNVVVTGWDVDRRGGEISYRYLDYFKITDKSTTLPMLLSRNFSKQGKEVITLEYRFKFEQSMDEVRWQMRNGGMPIVSIATLNNSLWFETAEGNVLLQEYHDGEDYGVKVVADIFSGTADVYINGVIRGSGLFLRQFSDGVDQFYLETGAAQTGSLFLGPVKIYKGYVINERFLTALSGGGMAEWQVTGSGGSVSVEEIMGTTYPDVYSLKIEATEVSNNLGVSQGFIPVKDSFAVEFKLMFPEKKDGIRMKLSGSGEVVTFYTDDGVLKCNGMEFDYDYIANLWYHIKILVSRNDGITVFLNGKVAAHSESFDQNHFDFDTLSFWWPNNTKGVLWLDDILLYSVENGERSSVPKPVKQENSDYLIGVQVCSLWREGSHLGWDRINGYPARKPYLGFYDEGSPETADWEIKWMVENGIGFQLYTWFRPSRGQGTPIKDPFNGYALHEGFFNAKYSDQMKFAIMFENWSSSVEGLSDFKNNIVHYWLEYYFKDPRYLVVDNKPVIAIYSYQKLLEQFGTAVNVREGMDYLRYVCKEIGFDGAIILCSYTGMSQQDMIEMKAAGIDSIFAYTWNEASYDVTAQKLNLSLQSERTHGEGTVDMIASISVGRDDKPWDGSKGGFLTVEQFASLIEWVRDSFIPFRSDGSLGKSIVLLDNWNEFGEGHFIMPSNLAGFGYLNAVRSVFVGENAGRNMMPDNAARTRINTLYPEDRAVPVLGYN